MEQDKCCKTCEHFHPSTEGKGNCAALLPVWVTDALPELSF